MTEHRPPAEFDSRTDQIQAVVDACRFLAFRPDLHEEDLESLMAAEEHEEFEAAMYRLDGEGVTIVADYPGSEFNEIVSIEIAGQPAKDTEGNWFAGEKSYKVKAGDDEQLDISVVQHNLYDNLDGLLLPEDYERIKEEYDRQRLERRDTVEGLAPDEVPNEADIEAFRAARLRSILEMSKEDVDGGGLLDPSGILGVLSAASERALQELDGGEKLRPYAEALERKKIEELVGGDEAAEIQAALGLSVVGDEELSVLAGKLKRLQADPVAFDTIDDYNGDNL